MWLLLLCVVVSTAMSVPLPPFSWDTLPVAFHSANATGRWDKAMIKELARYSMVTVKTHV
jgi:hypothetical protein